MAGAARSDAAQQAHRRPRVRVLAAALLALVLVASGACRADVVESPQVPALPPVGEGAVSGSGGTLRVAIDEPDAIVPSETADPHGLLVADALFDALTAIDDEQRVVGAAASRWYPDETLSTWTFVLREGATFHDGAPVTTADVVYAWERAVRLGVVGYHLRDVAGYTALAEGEVDHLEGLEVLDELTLRVHLSTPLAELPAVVAHPALAPLPSERWESDPGAERLRPVGNGPFAMVEAWARGRFIRAERADRWANAPRGAPTSPPGAVDEIVFRVLDADSAYLAFQQGRIDFADLPPSALDEAVEAHGEAPLGDRGSGVLLVDEPTVYELGFAVGVAPFDEPEVRRAVSLAVDRDTLAAATLDGSARPARSLVPPALEGSRVGACTSCRQDTAAARELFAAHDVDELTLWFSDGGGHRQVAERLRADLAAAGVRLRLRGVGYEEFLAAVRSGEAGMFRWGWSADHPIADDVLRPLFHSASPDNVFGYADPEVDALLDEARASADPVARRAAQHAAEDLVLSRDQVVVPLFTYRHQVVVSDRVRGFVIDPFGRVDWSQLSLRDEAATPAG